FGSASSTPRGVHPACPTWYSSSHPSRFNHVCGRGMNFPPSASHCASLRTRALRCSRISSALALSPFRDHARFAAALPTLLGYKAQNSSKRSEARSRAFFSASASSQRNRSISRRSCSVIKKFASPAQNNGPSLDTPNRHRWTSACAYATGRSSQNNSTQTNVGSTSLCCRCSRRWSSIRFRVRVVIGVSTGLRPQERRQLDISRPPHATQPRHPAPAVVHELERARRSAHAAIARRGLDVEHVHEVAVVLDEIRRDRADRAGR